jgi:hypothetical protein
MGTDRQEEEIESPVIEDFLDCDQLVSDSDGDSSSSAASPRRALQRLQIHVDMASTQYLAPAVHHHSDQAQIDGLPICSNGPQTVAFSSTDLDPYSAVSFTITLHKGYSALTDSPTRCYRCPGFRHSITRQLLIRVSSPPCPAHPARLCSRGQRQSGAIPLLRRRRRLPTRPRCITTAMESALAAKVPLP